jgi:hypothetical protein
MSLVSRMRSLFAPKAASRPEAGDDQGKVVRWLLLERHRPRAHIVELWTDIVQRKRPILSRGELRLFCDEAAAAMPEMSFADAAEEARTWGMIGALYFKALHPKVEGNFEGPIPCAEARACYEQAYRVNPDNWWKERMERH